MNRVGKRSVGKRSVGSWTGRTFSQGWSRAVSVVARKGHRSNAVVTMARLSSVIGVMV